MNITVWFDLETPLDGIERQRLRELLEDTFGADRVVVKQENVVHE